MRAQKVIASVEMIVSFFCPQPLSIESSGGDLGAWPSRSPLSEAGSMPALPGLTPLPAAIRGPLITACADEKNKECGRTALQYVAFLLHSAHRGG